MTAIASLVLSAPLAMMAAPAEVPQVQAVPAIQVPRDVRPAEQAAEGKGTISGTVTVAGTGQPSRRARVSLSGGGLRGRTSITDDMGRFAFVGLPAGRYNLSVSKPGHITMRYGQRRPGPGHPGTPIQLADGQQIEAHLQLPRGGVITGTVLDERGEAVPGTLVRALRYSTQSGARTLQQAGTGSTDDRGVYRIYGLQPGDYVVAATPRNLPVPMQVEALMVQLETLQQARAAVPAAAEEAMVRVAAARMAAGLDRPASDDETSGYAPVYYPGTTSLASAATVSVGVSEEKMGIDFGLQLVPMARVEGVVVTGGGEPVQNIRVSLVNIGQNVPGIGASTARPDRDGNFRLSNVAPGHYMLVARGTIGGPGRGGRGGPLAAAARGQARANLPQAVQLWAMTEVVVDGRNISNLALTLQPGMTISGRLVFEGVSTMPSDLTRVRVMAVPDDPTGVWRQIASSASGRVDTTGRFTISGVVPGRYRLTASGAQGWTLTTSLVSGQDTLDFPVDIKPNEPVNGAVLTFTDRASELTGTVVNERGEPASDYTVIVFPAEQHFWTAGSRRISSQRPGTDGRFTFRNLPPGEYLMTTLLDPEPGSWYDPALLQQLQNSAMRVPLGQGESKVQNLRVGGF